MRREVLGRGDLSFAGLLGDSPKVKLWEFLLIGRQYEYHVKDLANGAGISRPTCHAEIKELEKKGVVIKGGKYRGKQLYKLNINSFAVEAMLKAFNHLLYNSN